MAKSRNSNAENQFTEIINHLTHILRIQKEHRNKIINIKER